MYNTTGNTTGIEVAIRLYDLKITLILQNSRHINGQPIARYWEYETVPDLFIRNIPS